jgi:hypothetical protein
MISAWTDHLKDPEEKERFKKHILSSKAVLDRLQVLMNRIDEDYRATELNTKIYDLPNWDYRQADMNGGRRVLNTISKLISLDQQDTK